MSTLLALIAVIGAASCESQSERDISTPAAAFVGHWTQVDKNGGIISQHYHCSDGTTVSVSLWGDRDGEIVEGKNTVISQNIKKRTLTVKWTNSGNPFKSAEQTYVFSEDYKTMQLAGPYFPHVYVDQKEKP